MINIDIDTRDLSAELGLVKNEVDNLLEYVVDQVTAEFAYNWGMKAKAGLGSTRNQYLESILVGERGRFTRIAYLNPAAWLPNALETGMSAFDMKQGFLKSPKVKVGKNGSPYITIPFRFGSSGSLGESSAFSGVLPPDVERAAKSAGTGGLSLSDIPSKHHIPKSNAMRKMQSSIAFKQMKASQKTSIYEGLKKTSGGYVNFRRVSLNSAKHSWNHPGFEARNFAQQALSDLDIEGIVGSARDQFLINLGF